jgi:hypothetical protein
VASRGMANRDRRILLLLRVSHFSLSLLSALQMTRSRRNALDAILGGVQIVLQCAASAAVCVELGWFWCSAPLLDSRSSILPSLVAAPPRCVSLSPPRKGTADFDLPTALTDGTAPGLCRIMRVCCFTL